MSEPYTVEAGGILFTDHDIVEGIEAAEHAGFTLDDLQRLLSTHPSQAVYQLGFLGPRGLANRPYAEEALRRLLLAGGASRSTS